MTPVGGISRPVALEDQKFLFFDLYIECYIVSACDAYAIKQ
jgi:hypothetical protein